MLAVFHEFAGRGATHVDLRTREENSNAQAFYRSLGMTLVSRDPG
jgi:ribosomal protein S18 acetylase RimI-like enzyme